jgi:hypothetical protein
MDELDIQHDPDVGRFETMVEGQRCVLEYSLEDGVASMNHVGVPEAVAGRGIAGQLTRHALEWARERGYRVVARCPYVAAWIERHPEARSLLQ